jgi:hypothetical protein
MMNTGFPELEKIAPEKYHVLSTERVNLFTRPVTPDRVMSVHCARASLTFRTQNSTSLLCVGGCLLFVNCKQYNRCLLLADGTPVLCADIYQLLASSNVCVPYRQIIPTNTQTDGRTDGVLQTAILCCQVTCCGAHTWLVHGAHSGFFTRVLLCSVLLTLCNTALAGLVT